MHDLVIRNGCVVDGSGAARRMADVAIDGGVIAKVGDDIDRGHREIDAQGLLVTPGWVDIHTHYDGQVTWDSLLTPSCWHGVTTAVMGNCGVGFAPVRPGGQERLIDIMEGVEDIPGSALAEGIRWNWETFPQYLDAIDAQPLVMDVAAHVPHSAVRVYVMGERGARNEAASPEEIEQMSEIVREGLEAGAVGFSTSRTAIHRAGDGSAVPGTFVSADEMLGFGKAIQLAGHGVFEITSDAVLEMPDGMSVDDEFEWMTKLSREAGARVSLALAQRHSDPEDWRLVMQRIAKAQDEGADLIAQVSPRSIAMMMGWDTSFHPFMARAAYAEIADLPLAERVVRLKDPQVRARILSETTDETAYVGVANSYDRMFQLETADGYLDYEPMGDTSVKARAERLGKEPDEVVYDMMLENDGDGFIYVPLFNYGYNNLDVCHEWLQHPSTVLSLSDAGAHCGALCDANNPTFMLSFWTRDRKRGPKLSVEQVVAMQSRQTAEVYGLIDRGLIAPGMKADLNVIDYEALRILPPKLVRDLPAGGKRLLPKSEGYRATIVNGVVTFENGEPTGEMPGKLVRGGAAV